MRKRGFFLCFEQLERGMGSQYKQRKLMMPIFFSLNMTILKSILKVYNKVKLFFLTNLSKSVVLSLLCLDDFGEALDFHVYFQKKRKIWEETGPK